MRAWGKGPIFRMVWSALSIQPAPANSPPSVEEYVVKTATLRLKHDFPRFSPPKIANVNVEQVLESIKRAEVDVGTWINVIGYVERREEKGIFVQAVTIWDAGNVNLDAYQQAVQRRKEVG